MTICDEFAGKNILAYSTEWEDEQKEKYRTSNMDIVSKVGYLLGVNRSLYEKENHPFKLELFDQLEKNKWAKIIRILCRFRYIIMRDFDKINALMRFELKNVNTMGDIFDINDVQYLENNGIHLVKPNYKPQLYLIDINKFISENISQCKSLFPLWVEWGYIKELFIMPKGSVPDSVKNESNKYTNNLNDYPYQVYMSWTAHEQGNILYHDRKFLELLYAHHGKEFKDLKKVTDASISTKKSIYNYLEENGDTVIVVDCENSDPYKLYGTLKSLDAEEFKKIKKIILLNDVHTTTAWELLEPLLHIHVEYLLIERVKADKSLVDIKVTTETCREHYVNKINSFILCSSDSDYWGLITALKDANFLVMVEDTKCGIDIQNAFDEAGIVYCSMDDFTDGNINEMKIKALKSQMEVYIKDHMNLNVNDMQVFAYTQTRIEMSKSEKRQFYDNYVKTMRFSINDDGQVEVIIK